MAGDTDVLNNIVTLLRTLDDDAYASLANKGLLRRARKDLENELLVQAGEVSGGAVTVTVGDCTVRIPESGPAQATCSCPAPGCCQHILAACLRLAESEQSASPAPAVAAEAPAPTSAASRPLPDLPDFDALKKWAGADQFRRAVRLLSSGEVQGIEGNVVRFVGDLEVRLLAGALDAAITNAPPRQRMAYIAAAALAVLQQNGTVLPVEQVTGTLDLTWLEDLQLLIEEAFEVGLNHLSHSFQMRLSRLSVHCRVAGLIRVSLETESCAQEIEWLLARHGSANHVHLFDKLTRLYALAESIRQQGPGAADAYVGKARTKYVESGALDLVGVGSYPWETDSGFIGLTSLFWSRSCDQYFSWSDSRPKHSSAGFSPQNRYHDAGPWSGSGMLQSLLRSRFSLENAKSNANRRLSSHGGSRTNDVQPATLEDLPPAITRWKSMRERPRPRGLLRGSPLEDVVHARPAKWGSPYFDEIAQQLLIAMEDEDGEPLLLAVPFSQLTAAAVFFLESWKPEAGRDSIIGYQRRQPQEHLFPVRIVRAGAQLEALDILFQPMPTKKVTFRGTTFERLQAFVPLPQTDDEALSAIDLADPLVAHLSPIDDLLVAAAESPFRPMENADSKAGILRKLGLGTFADLLCNVRCPRDLLKARYVYSLLLDK